MSSKSFSIIIAAFALFAGSPAFAQVAEPDAQGLRRRMLELQQQVQDRSTPANALRSFFQHYNNKSEIDCLKIAIQNQARTPLAKDVDAQSDAIRDSFFTDLPVRIFHKFDGLTYAQCMEERSSYSYEIVGVEPIGAARTNITVVARNTTPLRAGMKPSEFDLERRRDGERFRFNFVKQGDDWKISQIEEWSRYGEHWSDGFKPSDLDPMVPSLSIMPRIL